MAEMNISKRKGVAREIYSAPLQISSVFFMQTPQRPAKHLGRFEAASSKGAFRPTTALALVVINTTLKGATMISKTRETHTRMHLCDRRFGECLQGQFAESQKGEKGDEDDDDDDDDDDDGADRGWR